MVTFSAEGANGDTDFNEPMAPLGTPEGVWLQFNESEAKLLTGYNEPAPQQEQSEAPLPVQRWGCGAVARPPARRETPSEKIITTLENKINPSI